MLRKWSLILSLKSQWLKGEEYDPIIKESLNLNKQKNKKNKLNYAQVHLGCTLRMQVTVLTLWICISVWMPKWIHLLLDVLFLLHGLLQLGLQVTDLGQVLWGLHKNTPQRGQSLLHITGQLEPTVSSYLSKVICHALYMISLNGAHFLYVHMKYTNDWNIR